jgi:trimethylamine--corrinoid protein Co-methyltransferase
MPLVVLTPDAYQMEDIFEMAEIVAGGPEAFASKPFVMPYLNTVSPLLVNPETVDKLFLAADRGTPVCVQAAPPVGGSVPVTVAGAAVVSAAETLAGLVLSQLRGPGSPYVSGVVPFIMDMSSGNTASSGPQQSQLVIAMGELCRWWGIPSLSTMGGDSKLPDEQAGFDTAYGSNGVLYGGHDLCFNAGRLECGLLHSPEVLVYANEAIGIHREFVQGVAVDDVTLALDVIDDVGPGGFFLGHQHTLDHFRELWGPTVASWEPRDIWEERGSTTMGERAREKVRTIRAEHEVAPLPEEVLAGMQAVIDRREATIEVDDD